ncbi:MAG: DUF3489 domain-containing protein [Candidatus Solibacter sp.]|nr:DUF3489 domain-containing protein [Candidatus Solibacter sp.]
MTNAEATTTTETAAVADQGAQTAPKATSKKKASKPAKKESKKASKRAAKPVAKPAPAKKDAKPASKKASKAKADATVPREFSKKAIVLDLLRRKDGATMAEIAKATDWQNHSIRGFISGNLTKKMGLVVESSKNEAGERVYRVGK